MSERQVNEKQKEKFACYSDSGKTIADVWTRVHDDVANRDFVQKTGQIDLDETIQESRNCADIAILKKQYEMTGQVPQADPSLIHGADLVGVPQNIHELYDYYNHAEEKFNSLPDGLKKAFGGVSGFMKAVNTGQVQDIFTSYFVQESLPKQNAQQVPVDTQKQQESEK